jgi:predicted RNA binding protein YcfA (HicA-like mRNA interferase family)
MTPLLKVTKLDKIIKKIQRDPHKVKAKDFVKMLIQEGFVMRKIDQKKSHRHFFHPEKPELMVVVVFSAGEETVLDEGYVKRYLKEINK